MAEFIEAISPDIGTQPAVAILEQQATSATVKITFADADTTGVWLRARNITDDGDFITLSHVDTDGAEVVVALSAEKVYQLVVVAHDVNGRIGP